MERQKYDYLFKLAIIGEYGVGKTCLLLRFTEDFFITHRAIGIDCKIKMMNLDNNIIKLQIRDTAGQERLGTLSYNFYSGCHGIILVYDVTNQNSFKNVRNWIKRIQSNCPWRVLVGNKCDKPERVVTEEEGKKLADDYNMSFFETSAKTNQNVNEVFNFLIQKIWESNKPKTQNTGIRLKKNDKKDGKKESCK